MSLVLRPVLLIAVPLTLPFFPLVRSVCIPLHQVLMASFDNICLAGSYEKRRRSRPGFASVSKKRFDMTVSDHLTVEPYRTLL